MNISFLVGFIIAGLGIGWCLGAVSNPKESYRKEYTLALVGVIILWLSFAWGALQK